MVRVTIRGALPNTIADRPSKSQTTYILHRSSCHHGLHSKSPERMENLSPHERHPDEGSQRREWEQ
jgi:hypothetical protein